MDFETIARLMREREQAIADEVCNLCKEPILSFEDERSKTEFGISGLCQACQDEIFTKDPFTEGSDEI